MDFSLTLLIINLVWLLVVASKWGREHYSANVRLLVSVTILAIAIVNFMLN